MVVKRKSVISGVRIKRRDAPFFFTLEEKTEYCELLADEIWSSKLCYLADIFEQLNKVNVSMQGRNENLLTCTDKMKALVEKIRFWNDRVNEGKIDFFSEDC